MELDLKKRIALKLSFGKNKKKLGIVQGLLQSSRSLLLLDEPTLGSWPF